MKPKKTIAWRARKPKAADSAATAALTNAMAAAASVASVWKETSSEKSTGPEASGPTSRSQE